MSDIVQDIWTHCYAQGWPKSVLVEAAYGHPAKFSYNLIDRIYTHAINEGWLAPQSLVLDCFGGVALGAYHALQHNLRWIGVELERHFHDIGAGCDCTGISKADWVRFYGRWEKARYLDGRHWCPQCLTDAARLQRTRDLFTQTTSYVRDVHTKENVATFRNRHTNHPSGQIPMTRPHHYTGNLDQWQAHGKAILIQGDSRHLTTVLAGLAHACIASPPYAGAGEVLGKHNGIDWSKTTGTGQRLTPGRAIQPYGDDPRNLGNLPAGTLCVSSPPFSDSLSTGQLSDSLRSDLQRKGHKPSASGERASYGQTPGNLATLTVSSPPYANGCAHTGGADPQPQHVQGGVLREVDYGEDARNLATMTVSSPPFEQCIAQQDRSFRRPHDTTGNINTDYGNTDGQLGREQGTTFWEAARDIVAQTYQLLCPGAHAIWVTKRYCRDGTIVDFTAQWIALCQSVGFELLHHHKALLYEDHGIQTNLFGGETQQQTHRMSFFRRLHTKKRPDLAILWEDVTCWVKPGTTGAGARCCVSRSPYVDALTNGGQRHKEGFTQGQTQGRDAFVGGYGTTPGNLEAMRVGAIQAVISSPPYVDSVNSQQHGIDWSKAGPATGNRQRGAGTKHEVTLRAQLSYGTTPGQLGAMPEGGDTPHI